MITWNRRVVAVVLFVAPLVTPLAADAAKIRLVSGLIGGQDSKSRELLALPPAMADQLARRELLSVLQSTGTLVLDKSRNVEGITFITQPYTTRYRYVCRADRVTLRYQFENRYDAADKWLDNQRQPVGVESQPAYHIEQLPVPVATPGTSYAATICNARHPSTAATWFAAPSDNDAVRAANLFRMAVDEVKAGRLTPEFCDPHGTDTCTQRLLSLDDPSKIKSVEPCEPNTGDNACYVVSFDSVDVTITGTILGNRSEPIIPTVIKSIRVDDVITISG
jgi:hypothetical protein